MCQAKITLRELPKTQTGGEAGFRFCTPKFYYWFYTGNFPYQFYTGKIWKIWLRIPPGRGGIPNIGHAPKAWFSVPESKFEAYKTFLRNPILGSKFKISWFSMLHHMGHEFSGGDQNFTKSTETCSRSLQDTSKYLGWCHLIIRRKYIFASTKVIFTKFSLLWALPKRNRMVKRCRMRAWQKINFCWCKFFASKLF